jgi:hypothetical protein
LYTNSDFSTSIISSIIFLFPAGISVNVFCQESQTINKNNDAPDFISYEKKQTGIKFLYPEDSRLSDYGNLIKIELMKKEEIESVKSVCYISRINVLFSNTYIKYVAQNLPSIQ